jgi:rhodanese-related sulfurtransferase
MSHKSASLAVKLGYKKVQVFAAGYPAWVKLAGKSEIIEIEAGEEEGSIDLTLFRKILAENPDSVMLIDVRDPDEYAAGHLPGAINITNDELEKNLKTMKVDKPLVFVCATGARSGEAYYMVQDLRPDIKEVYYVEATISYHEGGFEIKATE